MFIVSFKGGFANQLFIYAFYLKLKELFPQVDVKADLSHYDDCKDHGGFKLNKFVNVKCIKWKKYYCSFIRINEYSLNFDSIDKDKDYIFDGYWQDKKYFPKNMAVIFDIFVSSGLSGRNAKLLQMIGRCNSVAVHVRRGDYLNNYMHGNIANKTYFKNAIEWTVNHIKDPVFFVFSDDLDWCKKHLDFLYKNSYFVEGNQNDVVPDITLMSMCHHNIISNSSFSWWAQYLNQHEDKIVITPEYWFNQPTPTVADLTVDNAVKIPNTPYITASKSDPFFSIIIPVYNTSKTLRRTLSSVLNQTYTDIEIIIVNDCSTDNSLQIAESYAVRDKRIKIISHDKNLSSLKSRITGLHNASGRHILFLDSDDWLELNALELLKQRLGDNKIDVLEFGYTREPAGYREPIVKNTDNRLKALLRDHYPVTFWNKVYAREILMKAFSSFEPFYTTFAEDAFLSVVISCFVQIYDYLDEYLHHYSVATGISTQSSYSAEKMQKILEDTVAVEYHLQAFIKDYAPQYQDDVDNFMYQRYSFLRHLVMRGEDKVHSFRLLLKIDETLGTAFFDEYVGKLLHYESIAHLSFKSKCKFALKYIAEKILTKLHLNNGKR